LSPSEHGGSQVPTPLLLDLPRDRHGPVFREPWHAEAFALVVALNEAGHLDWSDWAAALGRALEAEPPADDAEDAYYAAWLAALEQILDRAGLVPASERLARVDAWDRAARATPHGEPITLDRAGQNTPASTAM
jgi:nitrile hydratase accessory protein